jgi:antitoxin HigA-1
MSGPPDGVGPLLKACLKLGRITQTDLARRIGVTEKHLSQLVQGHAMLTAKVAVAIERETGLDARLLLMADVDRQVHLARAAHPDDPDLFAGKEAS